MAVVALCSAKGAPGVTTAALALALTWPRPVLLVEADVAGSSSILAGYLRGTLRHDGGLLDLALAHRRGQLSAALAAATIDLPDSPARLLPGLASPAQAPTAQQIWEPLAVALRALEGTGTDVVVDAGRVGAAGAPTPLLREADVTLLTTRTSLPAVAATRARALLLREDLTARGGGGGALRLLLVGEGHPYSGREIRGAVGVDVLAALAWDPVHAEVFSVGAPPGRRLDSSALVRSVRAAASAIAQLVTTRRAALAPGSLVSEGDPRG